MRDEALRILVADDNEVNQLVIRSMLEYAGFHVETVNNGKEAISALENTYFDLIVIDCMMPVMDGFITTQTIRASGPDLFNPNIPILAITALATPEDRRRCMDVGMTGHIKKPVIADDLFAWIELHLGSQSRPGNGQSPSRIIPDMMVGETVNEISTTGFPGSFENLFPLLITDAKKWRVELKQYLEANQLDKLGALAHKIRGAAEVLGYAGLSATAGYLEKSGKERNAAESSSLVTSLIGLLDQLIKEIRASA